MITIRDAKVGDFQRLLELFTEFAIFEKMPEKMKNSIDRMNAEKEYFKGFVAVDDDGKIVGYATHFFCYPTWSGKSLYMDDLYVQPSHRGKGIGSSLMEKTITFAKESGCHKVKWQVSNWNNTAIEFYKKMGAVIGTTEQNCDLEL